MSTITLPLPAVIRSFLVVGLLASLFAAPAQADSHTCPALTAAVQVAACPTDQELKYTYMGFCGDNARLYGRDVLTCANFENYKEAKNTALWESADGAFSGYLSCNVTPEQIRAAKALRMGVESRNGLTRLICDYEGDHRLVYRSREKCTVSVADCSSGECKASCD
ncbi:hypothetical protein [Thauera sp. WH-1]|uniref:hypothetical protein n=1 Tax=Thauera sp. WH-1 TaxID=3398230 RepID=UPI0039FCADE2